VSAELRDLALEVAREAADLIVARRAAGVEVADTKTSQVDVVTEVDRASEQLIRDRLLAKRPDDAFLGEEGDDVEGTSGVRWIVDPVDGTVNLLYGIPAYAVSIAAEVDGEVVAGVVINVASGVEYAAARGAGATRDGRPIHTRPQGPIATRLVATGFAYLPEARALQADGLGRLLPQIRDIRRIGACALDLCAVAEGAADAYLEEGVHTWDHAAGGLIAAEAGAVVRTTPGRWGGVAILCAPADGYAEFATLVGQIGYFGE
jgi:myo-inositol-1(or 4)-monophosphatase